MAGYNEVPGYFRSNRPYYLDTNDYYDVRYQQMYGYQTPLNEHELFPGPPLVEDSPDENAPNVYTSAGITLASLITENLLSHPFIVLRRQCQVHHSLRSYHVWPHTLLPVVARLQRRQGCVALWKGVSSTCIVKGITLALEDLIHKLFHWPKNLDDKEKKVTVVRFLQHILLKCVSIAIVTPFYSASLVETVQSEVASDPPGLLDVVRGGGARLLAWGPRRGRLLPIWAIIAPTVVYALSKYIFHISVREIVNRLLRFQKRHRYEFTDAKGISVNPIAENIKIKANLLAFICSEVAFYPAETIIHRLHIQGTRTIIDNLDAGTSVQPILTNYEGFFDCYNSILVKEGPLGFYKGFGALILQLSAHLAIIKLTTWVVGEVSQLLKPSSKGSSKSDSPEALYTQPTWPTTE